ncbi:MAG: VWA domain-containing protein, partial [Geodermatophilaceae bacterium]|nr:VWA domain-containing protein [Geodermatophilaceae bacterium]
MSTVHRATAAPRIVATTLLGGLITGLLGMASVAAEETPDAQLEIVLDSSGSMGAADPGGGTKIEAARAALNGAVDVLPDEAAVGVRVYGGRYDDEARGCTDTRLVTPLGPLDRTASKAAFAGLRPLGYTPIAFSLEQAATDFTTQGPRTIVLVSDGEETCGGNPCEVARTLAQAGVDLRVDTVGYAADPATRQQLQCIAEATGGQYS